MPARINGHHNLPKPKYRDGGGARKSPRGHFAARLPAVSDCARGTARRTE